MIEKGGQIWLRLGRWGTWYSNSPRTLNEGDRILAKIPGSGFVGVGIVAGQRAAALDFEIDGLPALEVLTANYHRQWANDPEKCEYFVPVKWLPTMSQAQGVQEVGMFGNLNTVCKPRTPLRRTTVERLKTRFSNHG